MLGNNIKIGAELELVSLCTANPQILPNDDYSPQTILVPGTRAKVTGRIREKVMLTTLGGVKFLAYPSQLKSVDK